MALFDNIEVDETQEVVDQSVREMKTWIKESGAYDVEVTMFRFKESANGASGFVIEMITEDGKQITEEEWFSSRSGKTTYEVKDKKTGLPTGETKDLPGMIKLKSISRALTGDALAFKKAEEKIIPIYDFDKKAEIDKKTDVFVEAIGKKAKILVQRTMEDKTKKDSSGEYVAVAEYKEFNEVVGWCDVETGKTYSELAAGADRKTYNNFMANIEKEPIKDSRKVSKNVNTSQEAAKKETIAEPSEAAKSAFA